MTKNPEDYYFNTIQNGPELDNLISVIITPKKYYDKNNYFYDGHLNINKILPECITGELSEGEYESDQPIEEILLQMTKAGFIQKDFKNETM